MTEFEKWIAERGIKRHADPFRPDTISYGWIDESSYRRRDEAITRFAFAILDSATVTALLKHGPFLEVGAGTGYWAYELRKAGADIIATDPEPYSCNSHRPLGPSSANYYDVGDTLWSPIERLDAKTAIERYVNAGSTVNGNVVNVGAAMRTLLMVWPSLGSDWTANALEQFAARGGKRLVYVGEGDGGCTANDRFHAMLDSSWTEVESIDIPVWFGIHDWLRIYERASELRADG